MPCAKTGLIPFVGPGLKPASRVPGDHQSAIPSLVNKSSTNNVNNTNSNTSDAIMKDPGVNNVQEVTLNESDIEDEELLTLLSESWNTINSNKNSDVPSPCDCHELPIGSCPKNISSTLKLIQQVADSGVPNRDDVIAGNGFGWELGVVDDSIPKSSYRNHPSAHEFTEAVDDYIKTELEHGTLCGPLPDDCGVDLIISPIGTVPKPPNKRRVIVDSSFPHGHGVNDAIPKNIYRGNYVKVKLPTVEDIVLAIRRVKSKYPGHAVKGFKVDKARYYRNIPTCPRDWPKQCIKWKGKVYLDKAWSFGIRSAVQSAQRISDSVNWCYCLQEHGGHAPFIREALNLPDSYTDEEIEKWEDPEHLFNYIDDYIGISVDFLADLQW